MYLKNLSIINFKNISEQQLTFDKKVNGFIGKNGVGKTNILDAIYYLAYTKSYFNPIAVQNIRHNEDFFVIDGCFQNEGKEELVVCSLKKGQKKTVKRNGKVYERMSDHIGLIPMVMISPSDQDLISEGSEVRRKFIDTVISQHNAVYLQELIQYQKIISQRNALLKYFALNHTFDATTLEIYDEQLVRLGTSIFKERTVFMEQFVPIFHKYHQKITYGEEEVALKYSSALFENEMEQILKNTLAKDRVLQYTSAGIHKDDLFFELSGYPLKKYGSQGQQKSFLIALKLAHFDFIKKHNNTLPILLFDDIFDKLDAYRVQQIIDLVNDETFGQLFITDTHKERTELIVQSTKLDYQLFEI